ncbi:nucleotide pyrophosphohydrolase [Priestia megaterium]|uniref:nucleoside triphosphate pyrophosphohydrolase family protein n=1 Tax=Priestia megaterium TaxID=1404 RepID=UPI000BF81F6F|nr:nucleoside triphosphate pyrophosphohydrolase family protein [Priestia megaterium]PEZ47054.1 nucleotide pyrophosphohydrolase [Priestia megaterium]
MNVERYREAIKRTMNDDLTDREKLSMLALGIAGEAGEIVDKIKKVLFHGHTMDIPDLIKELGDLEWYLQHLKMYYEISDEKVRMENIQKLNKRYLNGFSEEASRNREEYKGVSDS